MIIKTIQQSNTLNRSELNFSRSHGIGLSMFSQKLRCAHCQRMSMYQKILGVLLTFASVFGLVCSSSHHTHTYQTTTISYQDYRIECMSKTYTWPFNTRYAVTIHILPSHDSCPESQVIGILHRFLTIIRMCYVWNEHSKRFK